jgi:hypothetical protein
MLTTRLKQSGVFGDDDSLGPPTLNAGNAVVEDFEKKAEVGDETVHREQATGYLA